MIPKIIKNNYYILLIYTLTVLILLMLYLGSYNLVEGNTCMDDTESLANTGLLNIINCTNSRNNISPITPFTDISSICVNNANNTKINIINAGGLGNQASNLFNSTGQLLSNAANANGQCD